MEEEFWWFKSRVRVFHRESNDIALCFTWNYKTDCGKVILAFRYFESDSERSPDDIVKNFVIKPNSTAMALDESTKFIFKFASKIIVFLRDGQNVGVVCKKNGDTDSYEIMRIVIGV